ncbi:hypothetical protein PV336_28315 [Streptomyces sp. MI02-2A]|nr:hypothetical protein [Streptomyces sp. MI02-2A]
MAIGRAVGGGPDQASLAAAAARRIAQVPRCCFYSTEQRSYPASQEGATRLHLTIDTAHAAQPAPSWPASSASSFAEHDPGDDA